MIAQLIAMQVVKDFGGGGSGVVGKCPHAWMGIVSEHCIIIVHLIIFLIFLLDPCIIGVLLQPIATLKATNRISYKKYTI